MCVCMCVCVPLATTDTRVRSIASKVELIEELYGCLDVEARPKIFALRLLCAVSEDRETR